MTIKLVLLVLLRGGRWSRAGCELGPPSKEEPPDGLLRGSAAALKLLLEWRDEGQSGQRGNVNRRVADVSPQEASVVSFEG